jgi:predicted secreted protein
MRKIKLKRENPSMKKIVLIMLLGQLLFVGAAQALEDQGLNSIISIIDKAVEEFNQKPVDENASDEDKKKQIASAASTIVNLSRTLGKLSYSRLQCGQADVLAEFTARVQKVPHEIQNQMRDAFQLGFDKSKAEEKLLSADECARLTQSRNLGEKNVEAKVEQDKEDKKQAEVVKKPKPEVDPKLRHLRLAELTGQLAYKRKFCGDKNVVTRDFNEVISKMPQPFQKEAKQAYWKGYKHGKRLNKNLSADKCR